jgi:hypothetical protein
MKRPLTGTLGEKHSMSDTKVTWQFIVYMLLFFAVLYVYLYFFDKPFGNSLFFIVPVSAVILLLSFWEVVKQTEMKLSLTHCLVSTSIINGVIFTIGHYLTMYLPQTIRRSRPEYLVTEIIISVAISLIVYILWKSKKYVK